MTNLSMQKTVKVIKNTYVFLELKTFQLLSWKDHPISIFRNIFFHVCVNSENQSKLTNLDQVKQSKTLLCILILEESCFSLIITLAAPGLSAVPTNVYWSAGS